MSKKTSVVLIFIGILLGMVGSAISFPLDINNLSLEIPLGTIASVVLLIIGCIGLYKNTNIKKFIAVVVLLCIYIVLNIVILTGMSTFGLATLLDISNQMNGESIEEIEKFVDIFCTILENLVPFFLLSLIPSVLYMILNISLSKGLSEAAVSTELSKRLLKGKKAAIFSFIGITIFILGASLLFNNCREMFQNLIEMAKKASSSNLAPEYDVTILGGLLVFIYVVAPAGSVFAIIGIVAQIKYIIAVGKLINDIDRTIPVDVIDDSLNNNSSNYSGSNSSADNILDDIMGNGNSSNNSSGNRSADSILDNFMGNNGSSSNDEDDESKPIE